MSIEQMIEEIGKNSKHKLPLPTHGVGKYFSSLIKDCLNNQPHSRPNFKNVVEKISSLRKKLLPNNKQAKYDM